MYHLLADWNRGTASCAHRDTARFIATLHQTADVEQPTNRCASCHKIGARGSWMTCQQGLTNRGYAGVRWTACVLGLALRRQRWGGGAKLTTHSQSIATVANLKQWPTSSAAGTWWALLPERHHHRHREGKDVCQELAIRCVKDTAEEDCVVERGRSAVECRTRNQLSPGSNPPLLPFRRLGIFFLSSWLSCIKCFREHPS